MESNMKQIILAVFLSVTIFVNNAQGDDLKVIKGNYYVIASSLLIREKPNRNARILGKKNLGGLVKILERSGKKEKIGDSTGEWVFIDSRELKKTSTEETIKGWVFDCYLSNLSNFKRVKSFCECELHEDLADMPYTLYFKKDGTYSGRKRDYETQKDIELSGVVYCFRNIFIADDSTGTLFMIKNEEGEIYSQFGGKVKKVNK